MTTDDIAITLAFIGGFLIFSPFVSILWKIIRDWWKQGRKPKEAQPQFYRWEDRMGSGPKEDDADDS